MIFLNDFLKKWFTGFGIGLSIIPIGKPIGIPVYQFQRISIIAGRPVYRFSTSQI
jgi:hypothetical protein